MRLPPEPRPDRIRTDFFCKEDEKELVAFHELILLY